MTIKKYLKKIPEPLLYWFSILFIFSVIVFSFSTGEKKETKIVLIPDNEKIENLHFSAGVEEKIGEKKDIVWDFEFKKWYLLWDIVWEIIDKKDLKLTYQEKEFLIRKVSRRYTLDNIRDFRENSTAEENVELFSWRLLNKTLPENFVINGKEISTIINFYLG